MTLQTLAGGGFQAMSAVQLEEAPKSSADTTRALVPVRLYPYAVGAIACAGRRALVRSW